ncbi:helix-turn-helix protein [Microbacteriaceae bacterium MWH-Ta3]|nr:helix-turn-helix protein [Microbacteriaceae bacterium MWH-Ta3]
MDGIFNVLADSVRRDILVTLRNAAPADVSVGELVAAVGTTQPTASKHLKVLREAGLVTVREEGQHRFYRLNSDPLAAVEGWVGALNTAPIATVDAATEPTSASGHAPNSPENPARILPDADYEGLGRQLGRFVADLVHEARGVAEAAQKIVTDTTQVVTEKTGEIAERITRIR